MQSQILEDGLRTDKEFTFSFTPPNGNVDYFEKVVADIKNIVKSYQISEELPQEDIGLSNGSISLISKELESAESPDFDLVNAKFNMNIDTNIGTFGDPSLFLKGLDDLIGLPDLKIGKAIMIEHCQSSDSEELFETLNYGGSKTSSKLEYEFVCATDFNKQYPGMVGDFARFPTDISVFLSHKNAMSAGLSFEEVICVRLFTGPMYMKYNAILRGYPKSIIDGLKGNRYTTTLHCIVSGIIKLSQVTNLPEERKVYRGLGGMMLPEKFWKPDSFGCCGGVEYGFMSTTPDRKVAIMYAGKTGQLRTVFEIDVGQIDRGASISWLSQYPHEDEFLMPPLSNLEVVSKPKLEKTVDGDIVVVKLRININLKSKTMEELRETRQRLHIATLQNLISETMMKLQIKEITHPSLKSFKLLLDNEKLKSPEWFNDDENYRKCQEDMMNMKSGTLKQDEVLRLATRCLTGKRSNEIQDKEFKFLLKEKLELENYFLDENNIITVAKPIKKENPKDNGETIGD